MIGECAIKASSRKRGPGGQVGILDSGIGGNDVAKVLQRAASWALGLLFCTLAAAGEPVAGNALSVEQIIEKNIEARGGREAWTNIQTMVWVGHIERGDAPGPRAPFVLEQKRPNKTRFEMVADKHVSARLFDGKDGWKVRPGSGGRLDVQPYSEDEIKFARDTSGIDGPLLDHAAKNIAVALDGDGEVEGNQAYRLRVTYPSGMREFVWIDAATFLELKHDREVRRPGAPPSMVSVYYRGYETFEGVRIPRVIETRAMTSKTGDRMIIDKVALNRTLEDSTFAKPRMPASHHRGVVVDTTQAKNPLAGRRPQ